MLEERFLEMEREKRKNRRDFSNLIQLFGHHSIWATVCTLPASGCAFVFLFIHMLLIHDRNLRPLIDWCLIGPLQSFVLDEHHKN